jgi:protocatechuate 3,4-dioxygenase beta subunit
MSRHSTSRLSVAVLVGTTALLFTEWRPRASGTISGVVFEDFNGNGLRDTTTTINNNGFGTVSAAVDRGVGNVTVTVFDSTGTVRGTTATAAANGSYSIDTTGSTGPYRVEFTNLPAGYHPSRFAAGPTGNGTTVQFVPDGNSPNINLGILDPANFCQNNPSFAISCFVFGNQLAPPNNLSPVIVDFPYSAGSNGTGATDYFQPILNNNPNQPVHLLMTRANQVGTTYGMAYSQVTNRIYASAFMKKHAGFGPTGPGAIYVLDPTALPTGNPVPLPALPAGVPNAGADPHHPTDYILDNGNATWDAVGKISLGGLEVSPDGAFIYVVNLNDRRVYKIATAGGSVTSVPVPVPSSAVPASGADIRPFALQYHKGQLYVGMVNSAESTQSAANLRAYVYALDPATLTFAAAPLLDVSLQYPRGAVQRFSGQSAGNWLPWRSTFATNWTGTPNASNIDNVGTYPQPMLTGLSIDVDGNLTIGLRDRAGDQFGHYALDNPDPNAPFLWLGIAGGDTLVAELNTPGNLASGWTLESNARTTTLGPTNGAGNNQGPGGGEYFYQEFYFDQQSNQQLHQELNAGAVLQVPGYPDVLSTSMNPGLSTNAGGIMWMSRVPGLATEGTKSKGYNLYSTPSQANQATFAKTNGLGEMVVLCQAAPIEIGNRVWADTDGDGVQDAHEPGLDGVTVQLIAPGGTTVLATVVTSNGGQYYFSSTTVALLTPNTTGYTVRLNATQGALGGRNLTIANSDGSPNGDSRDSDASLVGANAEIVVNTGAAGHNNHTYDFGFTSVPPDVSLGDFVWYDTNNNGAFDAGEQPIAGVDVLLYRDNGNGTFDASTDTLVGAQSTDAFGIYFFPGLLPGNYFVQIPQAEFTGGQTLFGYQNSGGQTVGDFNNRDHGAPAPVAGQGIVSDLVTLTVGGEPDTIVDGDGTSSNRTIDFGFYKLSLGNFVWFDTNNNGTVDAGELPAAGTPVELLNGGGTVVQTTTTDAAGLYGFTGLTPGDYRVRITPPGVYKSSTGAANAYEPGPDPDNDIDNDDNGTNTGGTITSAPVTLTPGAEPLVTNANGESVNTRVDFGLILPAMSLGNLVWRDTNNDGLVTAGEPGIDGVTVRLYNGNGTVLLNTMQTGGGGFYLFTGLQPGDYLVEVVPPTGLSSSTGSGNAYEPAPDPDNDIDNDDNGTTQGAVVRSLPVTLTSNAEPTNDGDSDPNSNLTIDFGFYDANPPSLCLGNLVWFDNNNNGVVDAGETGIPGVTVRLIGADGVMVIATTVTDANGNYLFCGLGEGIYYVEVETGLTSSTDIATSSNPDNDVDNDDNGVNVTTTTVRSNAVTLLFNTEPINDGDTDPNTNLTIDFGFIPSGLVSLGNLVWWDTDKDALYDVGEIGLQAIPVRLIAANGTTVLASTVTNVAGNYRFNGLQPGTYFVEVDAPVIANQARPSSPDIGSTPTPNNDIDNDDNGIGSTGATTFRSGPVTLTVGGEPVNDGDADASSNLTVDFGFWPEGNPGAGASMCLYQSIPLSIPAGGQFQATYRLDNQGPGPALNATIDGMLTPGATVVSMAPSPGGTCSVSGTMLECKWSGLTPVGPAADRSVVVTFQAGPSLKVGDQWQLWFMGKLDNPAGAVQNDCLEVDGYPFVVDANTQSVDLSVSAVAAGGGQSGAAIATPISQPVSVTFSVTNQGPQPASGSYLVRELSGVAGYDLSGAIWTQGRVFPTGISQGLGVWETDPIAPGATATLRATFVPRSSAAAKIEINRFFGAPADLNTTNDYAVVTIDSYGPGGGRFVATGNLDGAPGHEIVTGTGLGTGTGSGSVEASQVRIFSGTGAPIMSFYPFQRSFTGGVRVATCDVNNDGFDELLMAQGPGGGQVRVASLRSGLLVDVALFDAFEPTFTGGVNVACGDVDGDGRGEVIVGPEGGRAPDVRIFDVDLLLAVEAARFQAYESTFTGGVRVASAPFGGSGLVGAFNVITMPGPGRAGEARLWAVGGGTAAPVAAAVVAASSGARVALGDANADGVLDALIMPDGGVGALLTIYSLGNGAVLFNAGPGAAGFTSLTGTVGTLAGGPGVPEVVVGRGPGQSPDVVTFRVLAGGVIQPRLIFTAYEVAQ